MDDRVVKISLNCQAQKVMINHTNSIFQAFTSNILQESITGKTLLKSLCIYIDISVDLYRYL